MVIFESNFEVGDKAYTVDAETMMATQFEVGKISCIKTKNDIVVYLHPMRDGQPHYLGYKEQHCFHTFQLLKEHLCENLNININD